MYHILIRLEIILFLGTILIQNLHIQNFENDINSE